MRVCTENVLHFHGIFYTSAPAFTSHSHDSHSSDKALHPGNPVILAVSQNVID